MNIAVTGGGGTIGRAVVDRLVQTGNQVWSIVKEASSLGDDWRPPTYEIVGDAGSPDVLASVFAEGIDAVVHLAAIPSPNGWTARHLLAANSMTTITVLETAAANSIRHAVIASSISALGMAWSTEFMHPLYVPIDEAHPLRPTEGYALSKENDEAAARMAARRWCMTIVALRFPFTHTHDEVSARAQRVAADPTGYEATQAARELWAYLDVRDAAQAVDKAVRAAVAGRVGDALVLNVNSEDVLTGQSLEDLLTQWHPEVPVTASLSLGAYPITRARELIGFEPEYLLHHDAVDGQGI